MPLEPAERDPSIQPGAAPATRSTDRLYHVVILVACAAVLGLSFLLTIRAHSQVLLPFVQIPLPELCTFRRFAGLSCPGCGLTRSFISLAHADFRSAWFYNPAGLLLFPLVAVQIPFRALQIWRIRAGRPEVSLPLLTQITVAAAGVFLVAQWLLRLAGW
jgi:hypothetical protein